MKRILVFTTQMMETGGIESHLREFCLQMSSKVEVDFVVLNSAMSPESEKFFKQHCRKVFLCKNGRSFSRIFWLLRTALICRLFKYDAVYTNGQGNSVGMFASLTGLKHNWIHHHHMSGDVADQNTWSPDYRKSLNTASTIIACSKRNALDMEKVLDRSIDTIPCFSRQIIVKEQEANPARKIRFGYYGRLIPQKGIDILCRLSEDNELENVEFHIWGEGHAYPASYFEKFGRLEYHGTFNGQDELGDVIGFLDAFLLLSVHPEGLPICLLEAMSAGLPWLATDRGGISDIASDPVSTRMIPSDADYSAMKNAVKLFVKDIVEGKVSKKSQKKLYMEKFSSLALTNRWMFAFESIKNN